MFQHVILVVLNHEEIKKGLQRITKIKPFVNKYNWEIINFPSETDDWKKFEKKNVTIVLNILYANEEKIYPAYISKHNPNCEKQGILLMIPNGEEWHYLAAKKLSALLRGITSKHQGDFYGLNILHSFPTENKCESYKKVYKNKKFGNIIMSSEDTKILEFH